MTDRDVLERASRALREQGEPSAEELAELRRRVLTSNVKPLPTRRITRSARWVLPLAAAFMAATALAATPGAWQGMLEAAERFLHIQLLPSEQRAQKPKTPKPRAAVAAPSRVEPPAVEPPAVEPPASEEAHEVAAQGRPTIVAPDALAPRGRRAARSTEAPRPLPEMPTETSSVKPALPSQPSVDLTLYRGAHELHFKQRDYGRALSAWDHYLKEQPRGTFSLEARYNRALCLVRLGRFGEARAALLEFAEGKVGGGYRRDEAARFIEALDQRR